MRALPERDAAALLAVVAELAALDDADPFPPHFLECLARLFHCREGAYAELDRGRRAVIRAASWREGEEVVAGESDDADHPYWRLRHSHPVCSYRERTADWTTAHIVTDFMTLGDFRTTAIWDEVYRHDGTNDWLDVGLRPTGRHTRVFLFTHESGTFGERERLLLELLQPHLQQRLDRVEAAAHAADRLAALDEPHGDDPRHIVLCSRGGAIEYASPESRRLLTTYLGCANGHLPDGILGTRAFVTAERLGKRLTVRSAQSGQLLVVLLAEEDARLDRLTPRQRTILDHVACGRTDAEVACTLGIASATVNKHLEQIYERLDVHTRTAAAALVR